MSEFASAELTAGQLNALVKKVGGKDRVLEILRGDVELAIKQPCLLRRVSTIQVSGVKKFVAADRLKAANVGCMDDNFKKLFLNKVEENIEDAAIAIHRLEKASLDAPILAELGNRAETKLCQLFALLEKQSRGEKGVLLVSGYANIVYIRGNDGNLLAVSASWNSHFGYWGVGAHSVEPPTGWFDGPQVLSRDS